MLPFNRSVHFLGIIVRSLQQKDLHLFACCLERSSHSRHSVRSHSSTACHIAGACGARAEGLLLLQASVTCISRRETVHLRRPAMPPQRESRGRAADAHRRDTSATSAAIGSAAYPGGSAARGTSRSSEPWDPAEGSSSKRVATAAAASCGSHRLDGGRIRHGVALAAAPSTDASCSNSSAVTLQRRQSGDYSRRAAGGGVRSSSRRQQVGGSVDRRRSSSGSFNSHCSDEQEEEATCPLCLEALDETDRGLFPCECGYQVRHSGMRAGFTAILEQPCVFRSH